MEKALNSNAREAFMDQGGLEWLVEWAAAQVLPASATPAMRERLRHVMVLYQPLKGDLEQNTLCILRGLCAEVEMRDYESVFQTSAPCSAQVEALNQLQESLPLVARQLSQAFEAGCPPTNLPLKSLLVFCETE